MKIRHIVYIIPICLLMSAREMNPAQQRGFFYFTAIKSISANRPSGSDLYSKWHIGLSGLSEQAFDLAKKGLLKLIQKQKIEKEQLLAVIDFSKPSTSKRLFIINLQQGCVETKTLVAHGRNSGGLYARDFSNEAESFKSSLGFFVTRQTYNGANGYSLKLQGLEKGINDNAESRAIVMHGAEYVSQEQISKSGYLGRSHGCPAVPAASAQKIIDKLKGGTCMFIYAPQKKYLTRSVLLNG